MNEPIRTDYDEDIAPERVLQIWGALAPEEGGFSKMCFRLAREFAALESRATAAESEVEQLQIENGRLQYDRDSAIIAEAKRQLEAEHSDTLTVIATGTLEMIKAEAVTTAETEIEQLRAQVAMLREAIVAVPEWITLEAKRPFQSQYHGCAWCRNACTEGHVDDCPRQAALAATAPATAPGEEPSCTPARVPPPGQILKRELDARGWTAERFSHIIGWTPRIIAEVISGERSVTPALAAELAEAFGTSAELWTNLEKSYQAHHLLELEALEDENAILEEDLADWEAERLRGIHGQ